MPTRAIAKVRWQDVIHPVETYRAVKLWYAMLHGTGMAEDHADEIMAKHAQYKGESMTDWLTRVRIRVETGKAFSHDKAHVVLSK